MSQTSPSRVFFHRLWRIVRYLFLGLMVLIALYGVARVIDVSMGSFYEGSRSPYLQMLSDSAVTIRWQSTEAHIGVVQFGEKRNVLDREVTGQAETESHELRLTGLEPQKRYFYRVGDRETGLGHTYSFVTAASVGSDTPVRFWVTGDQGYRGQIQSTVKNAAWQWLEKNRRRDKCVKF